MSVENARQSRSKGVVAYAKFCLERMNYESKLFCFFEGDDYKYYNSRIENIKNRKYSDVITYDCGGRKGVEKVFKLISKDKVDTETLFFVDKDYISSSIVGNPLVYETPCYSIENLYTTTESFEKILNQEFKLNSVDADFKKCVQDFIKRQYEFHECITFLNAWLYCQREKEIINGAKKISLSGFKIRRFFDEISIESVRLKSEFTLKLIESLFDDYYDVELGRVEEVIKDFSKKDKQKTFRGKFELEFLKAIITDLRTKNKNSQYFELKKDCVSIDANVNPISSLSQYACTPQCLVSFLS